MKRMAIIYLAMAGVFLGLPAVGVAKTATHRPVTAEFSLPGSNGYRISVSGWQEGVQVLVTRGRASSGNFEMADYTVRGVSATEDIEADLGNLGEISVQFKPSGEVQSQTRKLPRGCNGPRKIVRRLGTFVGTIHFAGEAGYTTIDATEVSGSVGSPVGLLCARFTTEKVRPHHLGPPYLNVATTNHRLGFSATTFGRRRQAGFIAGSIEKAEGVSISRYITKSAPLSSFEFDPKLKTATVTPPAPFSGTATFRRGRKGTAPSWTGSLSVSFPGAAEVPLTGPSFTVATFERL